MPKPLPFIAESDRDALRVRGVSVETARRNQLRTVGAALVIPFMDLDGRDTGYVVRRPHNPRLVDGKPVKYESPPGQPTRVYIPAEARTGLQDPATAIHVTEGPLKALAMAQHGHATCGLMGVYGWNRPGTDELKEDWATIPLAGRRVYITFDYDPKETTRADVDRARRRLAEALRAVGAAEVFAVELPPGPSGAKQGVDDYLVAHGPESFRALVERAAPVGSINRINESVPAAPRAAGGVRLLTLIPPVLGPDAYHGLVGAFIRAVAPFTEATDTGVLAHLLPAAGTLIGPGPYAYGGSRQPARVNTVLVGPTSTGRKGTSLVPVDVLMARVNPAFWAAQRVGGLSSGEGLIAAVADRWELDDDGQRVVVPVEKRLYVVEEELSRLLAQLKRDGNIVSQVIRQAFDGGDLGVMTRADPLRATGAHISITGHITPEELALRLPGVEQANGFGNRFLWFLCKSDKVLPRTAPLPPHVFGPLAARLQAVAAAPARHVPLAPDAAELWERELYPELRVDRPGLAGAMTARGAALVLRLAVIFSQLDGIPGRCRINVEHLRAALAVWEYSRASCYLLFRSHTGTPLGDRLVQVLAERGPMKKSEFTDHVGRPAGEIDAALKSLAAGGFVRRAKAPAAGPGRPAELWELADPAGRPTPPNNPNLNGGV
jgi:hypothetical protein